MAMETVTTYKCDRCSRSEIRDGVTILTLTIRKRAGKNIPGQGVSEFTRHVCLENCLKIIKASMTPVGIAGQYDRTAAAQRRKAAKEAASATPTPTVTQPTAPVQPIKGTGQTRRVLVNKQSGKPAKVATKKAQAPVSRTHTAEESLSASEGRAATVKAVRAITRKPNGGWAKGYNNLIEHKMIAERESLHHPSAD